MGFQELKKLAAAAGLVQSAAPVAPVAVQGGRRRAEARLNSLGDVVDELLRQRVRFSRLHPRLTGFRAGTVTEHLRQRVRLGEARVVRPGRTTNRAHACPTEWEGVGKGNGAVE